MDGFTQNKLNLNPRSDEELQGVLASFEQKWRSKVRHHFGDTAIPLLRE